MIESKDLRRNNLVYRVSDKAIKSVNTIFCNSVCLLGCNDYYYCQEIEPIPLTAEIFKKVGFENDWGDRWSNELVQIEKSENSEGYLLLNGEERSNWNFFYRYLHQLQNLYYALTGEELEIKL